MPESRVRRVLLVDDEPSVRELVRELLESHGYPVTTAASGAEAVQRLATDAPALVIVDWWMPDLTGGEFLAAMRALGYTVPAIIMTALTTRGQTLAGHALVSKLPANGGSFVEELLTTVRAMVGPAE